MMAVFILPILLFYLFFTFIVAFLGQKKEIGFWGAFIVSTLLSPLIGLLIVIASKPLNTETLKVELDSTPRQEAIAKLKEAKDLVDLEMMSKEEFNSLKEELTPIIKEV
ncbi:hypothetical protein LCM02_11620 [Lutimonas saemankumensis]|uniref:hypothetical protein n=1 Tax=Lutimonas saemankumensis TaxID=483016 RepID=UPI001CD7F13C|nr:hypothetical protein [Lutimonas saemankumensis]MCA0933104.1 hypothetical protein [Lutimonas saemankumensis]